MVFETYDLPKTLKDHIERIFFLEGFIPEHKIERVVPTGHIFLIVELDGTPRHTHHNKSLKIKDSYEKAWISGAHKNYLSISTPPIGSLFVIQFKPLSALSYLNFPLLNLRDRVISAEQVLGNEILKIRQGIIGAVGVAEKFEIVRDWLERIYNKDLIAPDAVKQIFENLVQNPDKPYKENISSYPKSQKHLIAQFKKYNGLSPKLMHRIMRFNQIFLKIKNQENVKWSDITYQLGYSDQSHFIKEFKAFSGFNPQEFIKNDFQNQEVNFFPIPEI